jgi:monoamine oxidase
MTDSNGGGWTRRRFLEMAGRAGGAAAVYEAMVALGLLQVPGAWAGPPEIPKGSGKVLVLGAGIGGLTAASMLRQAGYDCTVLEAQAWAGGRSLTARQGTVITEKIPGHKDPVTQTCQFDRGLYLNMGPGRIPYHHRRVLHYSRELRVPLEVYVMETTANVFYGGDKVFDDKPMVNRRIANDTRGYIAELLAKAVRKKALDEELKAEGLDSEGAIELFLDLLRKFGALGYKADQGKCPDLYTYCGSDRLGCTVPITVQRPCEPPKPLGLEELVSSKFWTRSFYQPIDFLWQPTLFQPVGGMDQLVKGFEKQLGDRIRYGCAVTAIDVEEKKVRITYVERGSQQTAEADYCVSDIPLPVLKKIPANFEPSFHEAVQSATFDPSCKVGWQAEQRFWELKDQIYGGISWTVDAITQMWYPSNDWQSAKGTLTGAYNYRQDAKDFGDLLPAARLQKAREQGARLHPEIGNPDLVGRGLSIAWQNVPFQEGAWANWTGKSVAYGRLLRPDRRRFYVTGDQVSQLPGWQEGAMMSAEHVVKQIAGLVPLAKEALEAVEVPDTRALVEGGL